MTLGNMAAGLSLLLGLGGFVLAGCGGNDDHDEETEQGHDPTSPSCAEIMDVCHAADEGSGPAHDCHDLAHADVEDECAAEKESCLSTCEDVLEGGAT